MNTPVKNTTPELSRFAVFGDRQLNQNLRTISVTAFDKTLGRDRYVAEFPFNPMVNGESRMDQAETMAQQFAYMMNLFGTLDQVFPPVLDECLKGVPHAERRLEMAIVANLIHHLEKHGFKVVKVHDGEVNQKVSNMKDAMEVVFSVDDSLIYFQKEGFKPHWVQIICGNGQDCIVDYSYNKEDNDGFDAANKAFDAESIKSL